MFRPGEYGGFDIPYVHIRTYIFKNLNRYKNRIFPLICVENPVCFLVRYVCKNNHKITRYKVAKQNEPRNAVFIKKGWFVFWCIVCPPIAFLYVVCADSVEI